MRSQTANPTPTSPEDWDAQLYDQRHRFVSHLATDLLQLLDPQSGEDILDLGCGTGYLTYRITTRGAQVVGIDQSCSMIEQASRSYPDLNFAVADAKSLEITEKFDAVFSNAVLHWIKPPENVISAIQQALKPGGRFVAEFGGKGNIETIATGINQALDEAGYSEHKALNPWYFPSIAQYGVLLEQHGFQLKFARLFERPTPLEAGEKGLRNWIKMFASCFFEGIPSEQQNKIFSNIEKKLAPKLYKNGTWVADYKRIRVLATKMS